VGLETCHRLSTGNPSPFTPLGVGRTRLTRAGRMQKFSLRCLTAIPLLKSPTVATFTSPQGRVRSIAISVSVCLSVRLNILKTTCKLHEIFCTCCCGRHQGRSQKFILGGYNFFTARHYSPIILAAGRHRLQLVHKIIFRD